jgi:aminopeptidase-like protein
MDGQRLFSTADHPAHVMSYSLPYEGTVSRDELLRHLHSHPTLPDAIPFVCAAYARDWGLCSSQATRESLDADRYRVVIRSHVSYSSLKVGEAVVPGQTDETVLLCANLLGPAGSDAGVSSVAVGMEVMRRLMLMPARRYTYRFLILPGTTGVAAWLNAHTLGDSRLAGGMFLTTLATRHPFTLQQSPAGDTELDRCFALALRHLEPAGTVIPFAAGDEASQFNAPGFHIPIAMLFRSQHHDHPASLCEGFPPHLDDLNAANPTSLEQACTLILAMLDNLELNAIPEPLFTGVPCLPAAGVLPDELKNLPDDAMTQSLTLSMDGRRSLASLATELSLPFARVRALADGLVSHGLCRLHAAPPRRSAV